MSVINALPRLPNTPASTAPSAASLAANTPSRRLLASGRCPRPPAGPPRTDRGRTGVGQPAAHSDTVHHASTRPAQNRAHITRTAAGALPLHFYPYAGYPRSQVAGRARCADRCAQARSGAPSFCAAHLCGVQSPEVTTSTVTRLRGHHGVRLLVPGRADSGVKHVDDAVRRVTARSGAATDSSCRRDRRRRRPRCWSCLCRRCHGASRWPVPPTRRRAAGTGAQ